MSRKLIIGLAAVFLISGGFGLFASSASAADCTYSGGDGEWNTVGHWSCGHVPTSGDDIVIPDIYVLSHDSSDSASVHDATFNGSAQNQILLTVSGTATFAGALSTNYGTIVGAAAFADGSFNAGTTTSATFTGASYNYGTTTAAASFSGTSINRGKVGGNATFADSSYNSSTGTIAGNATFSGTTYTRDPTHVAGITGTTTFSSDVAFNLPLDTDWLTDTSNWVFSGGTPEWTFSGAGINLGVLKGNATFPAATYDTDPIGGANGVTGTTTLSYAGAVTFTINNSNWTSDTSHWASSSPPVWNFGGAVGMNFGGVLAGSVNFSSDLGGNFGTIYGPITFNESSFDFDPLACGNHSGTVTFNEAVTFNIPNSLCGSGWGSNVSDWVFSGGTPKWVFSGSIKNSESGVIIGNIEFRENSYNRGTASGTIDVYYPSPNPIGGTATGTITYHDYPDALSFTNATHDGDWNNPLNWSGGAVATSSATVLVYGGITQNTGAAAEVASITFVGASTNNIVLPATATIIFNDSSVNYGTLTNATFNDSSQNKGVIDTATFNESSHNESEGTVTTATFKNSSWNLGTVTTAIFDNSSGNLGTVTTATFNNDSTNSATGQVTSEAIFTKSYYTASPIDRSTITGTIHFTSISTVLFALADRDRWTYDTTSWVFDNGARWAFTGESDNTGVLKGNVDCAFDSDRELGGTVLSPFTVDYDHEPVYFNGSDDNWNDINNWWTDDSFTTHPATVPDAAYDRIYVYSSLTLPANYGNSALYIHANGITLDGAGYTVHGDIFGDGVNAGDNGFDFTLDNLNMPGYSYFDDSHVLIIHYYTVSATGVAGNAQGGHGGTITIDTDGVVPPRRADVSGGATLTGCTAGGLHGQVVSVYPINILIANDGAASRDGCTSGTGGDGGDDRPPPLKPPPGGGKGDGGGDTIPSVSTIPFILPATSTLMSSTTLADLAVLLQQAALTAAALSQPVKQAVITAGVLAGASQLIAFSTIASLSDIYLLILRGFGALASFLGIRRKRKQWGVVYDSVTKRPLDPVYVTVWQNGKQVASAITDIEGRYGFNLPPGLYQLRAKKTNYTFPSRLIGGEVEDEVYANLYYGNYLQVKEGEPITSNIPMDPTGGFDWNEYAKGGDAFFKLNLNREIWKARIYRILSGAGLLLAVGSYLYEPGALLNAVVLIVYILLMALGRFRLGHYKLLTVKRQVSGEPIPFAIVRVFLAGLNKEVKTIIADKHGRLYFLVRPGSYYLTVDRKLPDGSYYSFFKSEVRYLSKGVWPHDIVVTQYKEEEKI